MPRTSRRRPGLALSQPASAVELQEDTRRVLERRDRESGKLVTQWVKVLDAAAGTTIGLTPVWANARNGVRRRLVSAEFITDTASAANGTNYAVFLLTRIPVANRADRKHVATLSTRAAGIYAQSTRLFTIDGTPQFEPGDTLSVELQKIGTGVITGAGSITFTLVES